MLTPIPTIGQLLYQNAERYGEKVAYESPERSVTHRDLESKTRRIANNLQQAGIDTGQHVIVLLDRCIEVVESIFAVIRAGAVAVPLDPRCSRAELVAILEDVTSEARWIITDALGARHLRSIEGNQAATIWTINATETAQRTLPFEGLTADNERLNVFVDSTSTGKAFIHYTSGSTGNPKGVISTQQAWIRSALSINPVLLHVGPEDKIFCPLPITHAYGHNFAVMLPLCTGATAYLTADQSLAQSTTRTFSASSCTILIGVPTTFNEIVSLGLGQDTLSSLRMCISSGAPPPPALREHLATSILNVYGMSETCGPVAICNLGEDFVEGSLGSIAPHVEVRMVNAETAQDVTSGDEGEIWVKCSSLFSGYHKNTAQFLTDGWYRTGDIGRQQGENCIITGRLKDMIIRGGQNIHAAEVERVLDRCPGVKESVVLGAHHEIFGEVPVAYVVPNNEPLDLTILLAACRDSLSNHKVPVAFYEIEAIPRLRGGKLHRSAVKDCNKRQLVATSLTSSAIEAIILAEFAHARGLAPDTIIDPTTDFSDLGTNSLASIVVRDRLVSMTGLDLPITLLLEYTSPRSLAEHLSEKLSGKASRSVDTVNPPAQSTQDSNEPIAIVSMACKYPGGIASPQDLWGIIEAGMDVTSNFPSDRGWNVHYASDPDQPRATTTQRGGFLHDMADFDAGLFGMSPKEATATDPQQRLLLESTWALLERAGLPATSLRGSDTGVYVGIMYNDYSQRWMNHQHELEGLLGLGSAASVAAGRISYTFDFHGPSLSIDTACSSSLVAVDLAVKALRAGECSLAVAGGVTTMATPQSFIIFSKQRGLSPDGHCRSYSDDANGTAWSEGVGLVLLERLSEARRLGHQVLGLVRGSATTSDGKSSTLTAPSGPQQERTIRKALCNASLLPADVDVIDGHGTATPLGDPIEVRALMNTYGQDRTAPALLGSVKSNLGHTQAAAGVAGVIKMVIAMRHGIVPASIHVSKPSRHIDWDASKIKLATKAEAWSPTNRPRRAAVSAFGIGGTNAHVILEEGDISVQETSSKRSITAEACPWVFSAASEQALRAQAVNARKLLRLNTADVAFSLATTRAHLKWRDAIPPNDAEALESLAQGSSHPRVVMGQTTAPRLVMIFSGQGGQSFSMFEGLSATLPVFAAALKTVCDAIDIHLEKPLLDLIRDSPEAVHRIDITQPAVFAFQVALFRTLEHFGLVPSYIIGHSVGEIAAAHVSGILSLADAAKMVVARGRLMATAPEGAMVSIEAPGEQVQGHLNEFEHADDRPVIAAVNSRDSVVISGSASAVQAVADHFRKQGHRTRRLPMSHACHSPSMEPILPVFKESLNEITFAEPQIPIISTVTGKAARDTDLRSPEYWTRQIVAPVRFADAVQTAKTLGGSAFLEVGPSPALTVHVPGAVATGAQTQTLIESLAHLHVQGCSINWSNVLEGSGARKRDLPTYAFQRRRYWIDPPNYKPTSNSMGHPFLEHFTPIAGSKQIVLSGWISPSEQPWLKDHVMAGRNIVPATALAEVAVRAGTEVGLSVLDELTLLAPLDLAEGGQVQLQVLLNENVFEIFSRAMGREDWILHASGALSGRNIGEITHTNAAYDWPDQGEIDITGAYEQLHNSGLSYGPAFRCVQQLWQTDNRYVVRLALPKPLAMTGHVVHPVLLDAAIHALLLAAPTSVQPRLPFQLAGVRLWPSKERQARVIVHSILDDRFSVRVHDLHGKMVAEIDSVVLRTAASGTGELFALEWFPISSTPSPDDPYTLVRVNVGRYEAEAVHAAVNSIFSTIKEWSNELTGERLVVVTERATTSDPDLSCAAVWGFVHSAQAECDDRLLLVDTDGSKESEDALETAIQYGEPVVAVREGKVLTPKLVRETSTQEWTMETSGTILITGGTGALGRILACHLVRRHGAKNLLLVSRSGSASPGVEELMDELEAQGAQVAIKSCDVSNYDALEKLLHETTPPVTAIYHAAGVLDDALVDSLTPDQISRVLRPKVDAAYNLHILLPHAQPFVLFSSAAGILGNPGQATHAAANTFLDALARQRRSEGLHALSLAWGPWKSEMGMAGQTKDFGGLLPMSDQQGMELLDAAMGSEKSVLVPLMVKGAVPNVTRRATRKRVTTEASGKNRSWRERLARMSTASERNEEVQRLIRNQIADVLGYGQLPDLPLSEIGLDSLTGVQIRNRLSALAGVALSSSVLFEHDSVPALARVMLEKIGLEKTATPPSKQDQKELRLTTICQRLARSSHFFDMLGMLSSASLTLSTFRSSEAEAYAPHLRRLQEGTGEVAIVCLPDFFPAVEGISIFRHMVSGMDDLLNLYDLTYPVDPVPADLAAFAEILAHAIHRSLPERKIVLLGYSAGGLVANLLAQTPQLEHMLCGLILIDTYQIPREVPHWLAALPGRLMAEAEDDVGLLAMGHYVRLMTGYELGEVEVPKLLVRASEPTAEMGQVEKWKAVWDEADCIEEVQGNHISMMREYGRETGKVVSRWVEDLERE